jgi:hypothetical protein
MKVYELLCVCALAGAELAPERIERIATWNLSGSTGAKFFAWLSTMEFFRSRRAT